MSENRHSKQPVYKADLEETRLEHVHLVQTMADVADDHQHLISGASGPPIPKGRSHVHRICLRTSYDPKGGTSHWHMVDVMTGPEIEIDCDEHTHAFCGETSFDAGHCHDFCSVTDASPEEMCYEEEEEECKHHHCREGED